ncbi:MAG: VIT1/CCC1 transporter family protein [bacterium]
MKHSYKTGFSFGITSAVITTLGLMVGLNSGTGSRLVVMGAIFTIAIADSSSDALGIHLAEEAENVHSEREIWEATLSTFLNKFIGTLTFLIPVFLFDLGTAVIVNIVWGMLLLSVFSIYIARDQEVSAWKVVMEHLVIAGMVILVTHLVGELIAKMC